MIRGLPIFGIMKLFKKSCAMKKPLLILLLIGAVIWTWSCNKEEEDLSVKNLRVYIITSPPDSAQNVAVLTATAHNSLTFTWDLQGIDSTATGMQVTVRYPATDTFYLVTCTAKGAIDEMSVTDTVQWK